MKAGDRIRLQKYILGHRAYIDDYTIEEFRYCLGIFLSEDHRKAGNFITLNELYEPGPYSKTKYISNYGEYQTDMVQKWMDIP